MKTLTKSIEDYIETIYMIKKENIKVRSIDIATKLGVSKPAVNNAMKELCNLGLINDFNYSDISLTKEGETVAKKIYSKHMLIYDFLIKIGVSSKTAEIDCCKMEHNVSDETIKCIKKLLKDK